MPAQQMSSNKDTFHTAYGGTETPETGLSLARDGCKPSELWAANRQAALLNGLFLNGQVWQGCVSQKNPFLSSFFGYILYHSNRKQTWTVCVECGHT